MEEIKRVFFHELGHFISHEIWYKFFKGHKTKFVKLKPYPQNPDFYIGEAKIEHGKDKYVPSREELTCYLATCTYGCFFQAYYQQRGLKECQNDNGGDDLDLWFYAMREYGLDHWNADIHDIDLNAIEDLKAKGLLEPMMKLDPQKYLIVKEAGEYQVNLDLLREDVKEYVDAHQYFFGELVKKYEDALIQEG